MQALRGPIDELLAVSQPTVQSAAEFLREHARSVNELDNYARDLMLERIAELSRWLEPDDTLDLGEFLQGLLREQRVLGLGPRPGCLHVAGIQSGGHSARPHTFIVGLDTNRFPTASRPDPVLLDNERRALSPHLTVSGTHRAQSIEQFEQLLARLRGTVTVSYSCRDVIRDNELFPGLSVLVEMTAAVAPRRAEECLTETEWWLWRLCTAGPVSDPETLVGECFPWLGRGVHAAQQRASEEFTAYDGYVPEAGPDLDPAAAADRLMSPRRLETLGTCPLRYFYQYALGLELPEELEIDPHRWLPPAEFGQLLHDAFHRFLRDGGNLTEIVRERIAHYREKFPPPNEGVFRRDCRQLERAAQVFLAEEENLRATYRPMDFEREISGVPIRLPDGTTIHVRGRIDRVDETEGKLALWDYKTGSTFRFRGTRKDPFSGGRILQHALYLALAESHYRRPVVQFGYFFPTDKGRGERIIFKPEQLTEAPRVLARLREMIVRGVFPATDTSDDCTFCDYRSICRDVETVAAQSKRKGTLNR